ncbi:efflux RND transporter periplasmic adaptor subunit [Acidocella sp.]|uniref:efflux RND transporter periplasmic adaptor subunit n=1 Tax=Acidocella sp. TaxID=50710 RepID=UPI00260B6933|nr:efflux RND transporter periplasmic adaptor subunit [Acidocella sp.]
MAVKSKKTLLAAAVVLVAGLGAGAYRYWRAAPDASHLTLYGNVDIREVYAAFYDSGRIDHMLAQEGDAVHEGELIATLDQSRFADALATANGQAASQQQILAALLAGSRPEQIAQAKAQMDALEVVYQNDAANYNRYAALAPHGAATIQQRDDAQAAWLNAKQNYQAARQAYILAVKGPRAEDIAAAQAAYDAAKASAALAAQEYDDTKLYAPADGIIEERVQEPGDMTSPSAPVYVIALTNPLWVRAYVPESDLGRVRLGMTASISTDSYPGKTYRGWVGYISPTAEFTPKTVETPDLRAQLVYQLRVYACNAQGQLQLGMPATVSIGLAQPQTAGAARGADACGGANAPAT